MVEQLPQCQNLQEQVNSLLALLQQEPSLRAQQDTSAIETSLKKALSPKFEIVFAGAFSAGKSMLINAILGKKLLYSSEGHATGTECYIEYAEPGKERVVLTFLSEAEICQQALVFCEKLGLNAPNDLTQLPVIASLKNGCQAIIDEEGGESKSERAKQAHGLQLLLEGFTQNKDRIQPTGNATYSMEQFDFSNLEEAASYARRGSNSSVLKRLEYYYHHPLLKDGNVLIDMPGIDAPVKKDADLTYRKIEHPDTSAVISVLKAASQGDMTTEETELLEKMRDNQGIRDRVFYVFNRIDQTWYNTQLRQRLENLIQTQFRDSTRVYKTSGLLGFYGSQIKQHTSGRDRFGLDTIFQPENQSTTGEEDTPQFVSEFNHYCANSNKLTRTHFKVSVNSFETPNENYVRILAEWGMPLVDQLIADSGIEEFRQAITKYLTEEKRPELFSRLADDLQGVCINLRKNYINQYRKLDSQPREIEAMKAQELNLLNQELQDIGEDFLTHIGEEINKVVVNEDTGFNADFEQLRARMITRLDELLKTFSVANAYSRATHAHPRNATAPLLAVLVEALYYLSNELEDVLIDKTHNVVNNFCIRLLERVRQAEYYRKLYRLLGHDGGIEEQLKRAEEKLIHSLESEARTECDRYVRESPRFYDEGTFSIYQFRQILQQTSQGYDAQSMIDAEPAIRQLLKLDFDTKVLKTVRQTFRQAINQTLKTQLLPMARKQADQILQQYPVARAYLEQTLAQEAEEKIARNLSQQADIKQKIDQYNEAVAGINSCLQGMQVYEHHSLPLITERDYQLWATDEEQEAEFIETDSHVEDGFNSEVQEVVIV